MPGGFQLGYGGANAQDVGTITASSRGTTVTAGASANTKGSYAELVASTAYDCGAFVLTLANGSGGLRASMDIAIGASGSEQIIIPDIFFIITGTASLFGQQNITFPIAIPAGTRISARTQASVGATVLQASITLLDGSFDGDQSLSFATTYGFASGTTLGVLVDPGGTANSKGAWTEIAPLTTYDIERLIIGTRPASSNTTNLIDIGVGASGSEVVLIPNFVLYNGNSLFPFNVQIPAGARITARSQSDIATAGSRDVYITAMGIS